MPFKPVAFAKYLLDRPLPAPVEDAGPEAPVDPPPPAHSETPPVYGGFARVVDYATRARKVMTAKFQLRDPADPDVHPFRGLRVARSATGKPGQSGQRLHMVVSQPVTDGEDRTLYVGEGMLTWWSDDCMNGMTIIVRFDSGPDGVGSHPLSDTEAGAKEGDTVYLACWTVADDETVVPPQAVKRRSTPFHLMTATQQSNILGRDDEFRAWCAAEVAALLAPEQLPDLPDFHTDPGGFTADVVRRFCGVTSRGDFRKDTAEAFAACQRWQEMMRRFDAWRYAQADDQPPPATWSDVAFGRYG